MISGLATAIKLTNPSVKVIGVEPELAADAQASLRAGKIVQFPAEVSRTMADGLRTQSIGPINFEHIRRYVDDIVTVTEYEILRAVRFLALILPPWPNLAEPSPWPGFCSTARTPDKDQRRHHQRRQHRPANAGRNPPQICAEGLLDYFIRRGEPQRRTDYRPHGLD